MNESNRPDKSHLERVEAALSELVEALDRRLPHVERLGEVAIAREAAALRKEAMKRLEQTRAEVSDRRAADLADAVMSDDGGPPPGVSRAVHTTMQRFGENVTGLLFCRRMYGAHRV